MRAQPQYRCFRIEITERFVCTMRAKLLEVNIEIASPDSWMALRSLTPAIKAHTSPICPTIEDLEAFSNENHT